MNIVNIDQHLHTKNSDAKRSRKELKSEVKDEAKIGGTLAISTDHDVVTKPIRGKNIFSCEGTEVSTYHATLQKYVHLNYYSSEISQQIKDTLSGTCELRMQSLEQRLLSLKSFGFRGEYQECQKHFENRGYNTNNLNNFLLSRYIVSKNHNRKLFEETTGIPLKNNQYSAVVFLKKIFRKSEYSHIALDNDDTIVGIEPGIITGAIQNDALFTFNHPHVTCSSPENYETLVKYYIDNFGINALEIPSTASIEWVAIILKIQQETNLILTFGSDDHGGGKDKTHGELFDINPYVNPEVVQKHTQAFVERLCQYETPISKVA